MTYMALARKWRPRNFSQLIGQEHVSSALMNALTQKRLHHAYLFTGTRGVGKTSIARILAKALNCELGIVAEPCLACDSCLAIEQGRFIDLVEIDGASKTRIEDTRDVLENVQYAPTSGRFKIYIIDEVHMLSQHSFNALLKTLEEPPSHVKFILATTEVQKLPITVLSRCLQFSLHHLSPEVICKQLQLILKDEQLPYELDALMILAQAARGSMRDALSLLDQSITGSTNRLEATKVKALLGYTQQDYAIQLLQALAEKDASLLIKLSHLIAKEGGYFQYVLDELLHNLHQVSIFQAIGEGNPLIAPPSEVKSLASRFSPEDVQLFYQIGIKGREELALAPTIEVGFDMTLLRMLTFRPVSIKPNWAITQQALVEKHEEPVNWIVHDSIVVSPPAEESLVSLTSTSPPSSDLTTDDWGAIIPQLKLTGLALNALENAELLERKGNSLTLRVAQGHQSLFTPTTLTRIEKALATHYKSPIKVILHSNETPLQSSPAHLKEKANQLKQQNAEQNLQLDPVFQQIQKEFSAELVKNSISHLKDGL